MTEIVTPANLQGVEFIVNVRCAHDVGVCVQGDVGASVVEDSFVSEREFAFGVSRINESGQRIRRRIGNCHWFQLGFTRIVHVSYAPIKL